MVRVVDGVAKLVDGQRSEGVEVTASGRPLPGMFITASYAYTDAKILSGPDQGNQPRNVAEQVFNFWGSYEVPSGPLYGLGTGVGVSLFEDRFGDDANTWNLGAYELVDFSVWYNLPLPGIDVLGPGEARVQFSVKNLTRGISPPVAVICGLMSASRALISDRWRSLSEPQRCINFRSWKRSISAGCTGVPGA